MTSVLMTDAVRYAHILAVALGLGASVLADLSVARNLKTEIKPALVQRLRELHVVIWVALAGMWVSGIALVGIRTGFDPAAFSPKLLAKFVTVTVLTINASILGALVLPMLERSIGQRPLDLAPGEMLMGGWAAAVSSASWLFALALGVSATLKTGPAALFLWLVPATYGVAIAGATLAVAALQIGMRGAPDAAWDRRMASLGRAALATPRGFMPPPLPQQLRAAAQSRVFRTPSVVPAE